MARPNNHNGGRPKKHIDWHEAEKLCRLQCSETEIADWFNVSVETLARRLKDEKGLSFREFFTLRRVGGKIALRRNLIKLSSTQGHVAIFLAKNWLGMSDKTEVESVVNIHRSIEDYTTEELLAIIESGARTPKA